MRKSLNLVSPNPPKTFPKYLQNRGPKKHTIFIDFGFDFSCFVYWPTLKFYAPSQCFVRIFDFLLFPMWPCFWVRKTSQKPLRNHSETMIKSSLKTSCFSTSIFSGFGLDFGGSGGPRLEPSWPFLPFWEAQKEEQNLRGFLRGFFRTSWRMRRSPRRALKAF